MTRANIRTLSRWKAISAARKVKLASRILTIRFARGVASLPTSCGNVSSCMNKKRNDQSRREFLKLCGLAGLGVAAPVWLPEYAQAATKIAPPYEGPFYVVFNASGG